MVDSFVRSQNWVDESRKYLDEVYSWWFRKISEPESKAFITEVFEEHFSREEIHEIIYHIVVRHVSDEQMSRWIGVPKEELDEDLKVLRRETLARLFQSLSTKDIACCERIAERINGAERRTPLFVGFRFEDDGFHSALAPKQANNTPLVR